MKTLLTPNDIRIMGFHTVRFREGYDEEEVDEFLEECSFTISTVVHECLRLQERVSQLEGALSRCDSGMRGRHGRRRRKKR